MDIHIKVIPESEMRAGVSGADWFFDDKGDLQVRVSPMRDSRYETLLAIHECVEAIMAHHNGVTVKAVDEFDQKYYETHADDLDAGDEADAPYRHEHCLATAIERILCAELGVVWSEYDRELAETYPGPTAVKK
jgi:hypothetical protein